ncbi:MAG: bifunctional alpha,alpha-trehalose-phosphate synthase (UDP-forming)/trehalose-phosphatase [Bacteroidales bacterium]|nr:bifunctional alpha,alpha-trehalose-phosphate synthase (UDP-forming)/trehalose-phosphatase [Bacteroidales bacterium]MDD4640646.1 bifunctional alpha,alpha-trehalose-phosphate synthase (UDP-forming)/trehalose-phosphatase [Bacteroidales bacterium]
MKLYIVANRLPVKVQEDAGGNFSFERSEGGLATGLSSLDSEMETHWVGWPGIFVEDPGQREAITAELEKLNFHPVFLNEAQIQNYYEGYSNNTIWPLCHYFYSYIVYDADYWAAYKEVNELFCTEVTARINPGDIAWVHDYQLMLLPRMIREKVQDLSIGYFHHIPFPSYELFRVLPERAELLQGLLGADLIAFHTHGYMRHFISTIERVMGLGVMLDRFLHGNRFVYVDVLPMGINYDLYNQAILKPSVQEKALAFRKNYGEHKLILSVDRLDYSKGILHRLKGFARFLEQHPEYREKVSLVMIVVPSRDNVEMYAKLKRHIDELIGSINGMFSTINWTPVFYFYHSLPFEELVALYHIADVALVSPLRDGMNLVAKEYVAAKRDNSGVLILSEMAGASAELSAAIIINPNDINQISDSLLTALEMPVEDQLAKLRRMQILVSRHTVHRWAEDFMDKLRHIRHVNIENHKKRLMGQTAERLRRFYNKSKKRLFILDYDGTLSAFFQLPEDARPTEAILNTLKLLSSDERNKVIISSGRDHETLDRWLGHLPLDMAAEHGVFFKEDGLWSKNEENRKVWDAEILNILQTFIDKTPGSRLEIKETALVWHYRNVDAWLAGLREQQLLNLLIEPCARQKLQIMRGNKILEIKSPIFTKGTAAKRFLKKDKYDFVLAMGDDTTDEDTFRALPKTAHTIRIGSVSEVARYYLYKQNEVLPFLEFLLDKSGTKKL